MTTQFKYKSLDECLLLIKNGANIKQAKDAGGIPITRIETLSGGLFNRDRLGYAGIEDIGKYESFVLEEGDLLFSHINSKAYIGRTVLYRNLNKEVIIHGMNLLRIKVNPQILLPSFLYYTSLTDSFKEQVASSRKDAVNQSSISVSDIKKIVIPVPTLEEQQRIVDELDLLSGIVDKKNAQLRDLDALAQSIFYEMFGDPKNNDLHWQTSLFGDTFKLKSGDGLKEKEFIFGNYPVYGGNGISGYHNCFNKEGKHVIIGRVGAYCGNVRYVQDCFWLTDNAFDALFDSTRLDYTFVCWMLNTLDLHRFANHAAQPVISNSGLRQLSVIIPPIEIQRHFAERASAIQSQKNFILASLKDSEFLLNSRMSHYFD